MKNKRRFYMEAGVGRERILREIAVYRATSENKGYTRARGVTVGRDTSAREMNFNGKLVDLRSYF